jgi:hypothetical protein
MTSAEFCQIGEALYGPCWRSTLADDLTRNVRTIRRWGTGESPVPARVAKKLRDRARRKGLIVYGQDAKAGVS